jgi:hypothetical protein
VESRSATCCGEGQGRDASEGVTKGCGREEQPDVTRSYTREAAVLAYTCYFAMNGGSMNLPVGHTQTAAPWMRILRAVSVWRGPRQGRGEVVRRSVMTHSDVHDRRVLLLVRCGGFGCL